MVAAAMCGEDEAQRAGAECAAGIEKLDLGDRRAALIAWGKRSVYLMDCEPVWGFVVMRGRGREMEDACTAVPRFADARAPAANVKELFRTRRIAGIRAAQSATHQEISAKEELRQLVP